MRKTEAQGMKAREPSARLMLFQRVVPFSSTNCMTNSRGDLLNMSWSQLFAEVILIANHGGYDIRFHKKRFFTQSAALSGHLPLQGGRTVMVPQKKSWWGPKNLMVE